MKGMMIVGGELMVDVGCNQAVEVPSRRVRTMEMHEIALADGRCRDG